MEEAEPPKENVDPMRFSWLECEPLPLPQLREGRGAVPSRGDVIEAKIADASGRAAGKVMLEALEVEPTQEAGILARVELANYAVQVLGMGMERKEFVVHLCAPQEPGRCEETGAALHCGEWAVVPGGAGRGVNGESAETSAKTGKGLRPEIAEAGPALFGPMDGERLGAQVAALADALGLDPPARPMDRRSFNAPRAPQLGSRDGDATPSGEVRGPSGGKKGVESRKSRDIFPSPTYWTPPAASTPPVSSQDPALMAVLQEKLKEARARLGQKRRGRKWLLQVLAESVLDSTADTLVTAELDSWRRKCHARGLEESEDAKAR